MASDFTGFEDYSCIHCMAGLALSSSQQLRCGHCSRRYSIIDNIAILTSRPNVLLKKHHDSLAEPEAELRKLREHLLTWCEGEFHQRIQRAIHGMEQNIALMAMAMKPVTDYLTSPALQAFAPVDWLLGEEIGYKYWEALPNFYQDWAHVPEFEFAESLIVNGLLHHRPDAVSVAILGAGACGIVNASAAHFDCTYGMDLSLPSLLLAQPLLKGKPIEIYFKQVDWQPVRLVPGTPNAGEIRLVAADANMLPFAENSLSAVVTQYLMDLLENPLQVAAEIRRILKPSGIWVNFSVPFNIPGEPTSIVPPGLPELKNLFGAIGLEFIEGRSVRFRVWNFDKIYPAGERIEHEVHFFCLRKTAQIPESPSPSERWRNLLLGKCDEWWKRIPRLVSGKSVQIIRRQELTSHGTTDTRDVKIGRMSVPRESLDLLERLFRQINGKKTLRNVWNGLRPEAMEMSEVEFYELIQYLANQRGILCMH